jgi:DNA-binding response OmpR family regulator
MKILVVDDEELLVKGIRFNLQNDGYQVVTVRPSSWRAIRTSGSSCWTS